MGSRRDTRRTSALALAALLPLLAPGPACSPSPAGDPPARPREEAAPAPLPKVALSADRTRFALEGSGAPFVPSGFNCDHDRDGRLLEDVWEAEWETVEEDFRERKALGANAVASTCRPESS